MKINNWQPNISLEILKARADLLRLVRVFFQKINCLEVETPTLSGSTTPDPNIESFSTRQHQQTYYLHTSPEFPMKRLLAAGSGAIYQICKVFRQGEAGRYHNPEFTMLEWYQPGLNYHALMQQVDELIACLLNDVCSLENTIYISYKDAFEKYVQVNPFATTNNELLAALRKHRIELYNNEPSLDKDALLDLIISQLIQTQLPANTPVFIYDYPASQAALAKIRQQDSYQVAERFELFINGVELANGYQELLDASEQQQRFEAENKKRAAAGLMTIPIDQRLIAALAAGIPMVSGVAMGFDRLLMLAMQKESINEVIAFTIDKA